MDYQLIPGHKLTLDVRPVTRYSSSDNMDYDSSDTYLVCECGWEKHFYANLGQGENEQRFITIEHSIEVLSASTSAKEESSVQSP